MCERKRKKKWQRNGTSTSTNRFERYQHKSLVHVILDSVSCLLVVWLPSLHVVQSRYPPRALAASLSDVPCQRPKRNILHVRYTVAIKWKAHLLFHPKEPRFLLGSKRYPLECHHSSCQHISFQLYPAIPSWLKESEPLSMSFDNTSTVTTTTYQTGQTIVGYQ